MTEAEAKTKWCPFTRVLTVVRDSDIEGVGSGNRTWSAQKGETTTGNRGTRCIASECMMWRPTITRIDENTLEHGGYCGLADRPSHDFIFSVA